MRPKEDINAKAKSEGFILSEKIDDTKSKRSEKEIKKELKRLAREKLEKEKMEKKAREKEKERQKRAAKGVVVCGACGGACTGEVLRVSSRYFHSACFTCRACAAPLAALGFFQKDGAYYCPADYQRAFGTKCAKCRQYVEGEVVSALGATYHHKCFTCARCGRAFPSGEKVTYTGREVVCTRCGAAGAGPANGDVRPASASSVISADTNGTSHDLNVCAGCGAALAEGQALVALGRAWHAACFACGECGAALTAEYMGRGGVPYCERDYHRLFGVRCAYCQRYIAGKVLQAGEQHHFHPTCARCSKCGEPFGDGEEMFLQGAAVWHPRCGPAPRDPREPPLDAQLWGSSRTPSASGSYCSPYSSLTRRVNNAGGGGTWRESPHRITTYCYLAGEGLRRPLSVADRAPPSPHYHRPPASAPDTRASSRTGHARPPRPAMRALLDAMRVETPRPKSPHMNNEEPIELSHYPSAYKPPPDAPPKIERDDFPAPPYPYTLRAGAGDGDDEPDAEQLEPDPRLHREEAELAKISTGIAQVFLKEVKERERLQQWKRANLDPRNASRAPSAAREPAPRLRYPSPLGASPSRAADHPRPHDDRYTPPPSAYNVVSSLRSAPRPGYGLSARSHTFSTTGGDFTLSGFCDNTHSTDFSSAKSDISAGSIGDVERSAATVCDGVRGAAGVGGGGAGVRRSLPNMAVSRLVHEPARLYPHHLLAVTNYRLPPDVDRLNLEKHLCDAEFEALLETPRAAFYRLPQWRRNELKRRVALF